MSAFAFGCSTNAADANVAKNANLSADPAAPNTNSANAANGERAATIAIQPNSPSDTVRAFYDRLREKKFREAFFLTNLRPAIEGLTDAQLSEFQVDLESVAAEVPTDLQINGEVISGDNAVVMANLPGRDPGKFETQKLELRREGDHWIILTVDAASEKTIKKEGSNYFFTLRLETQQNEAEKLLNRIADVESVYGMRNQANYATLETLIEQGLLDAELKGGELAGYRFSIDLAPDKKSYNAIATPLEYGKSGKLSMIMIADGKTPPHLVKKDNNGKTLTK
jgi:hypothetical protein